VKNASSKGIELHCAIYYFKLSSLFIIKGGKVAGAFLGILFAAGIIYLWYTKTYGPIFKDGGG
jgi:hypothetical protein